MIQVPQPIPNPDPLPLMQAIHFVLQAKLSNLAPVPFIFEATEAAARHNWSILSTSYNKEIRQAIKGNPKSPLSYGSEFCLTSIIECLFQIYPLWDCLVHILEFVGKDYPLTPIDPEIAKLDLIKALEKVNSKGAQANPKVMEDLIKGDVDHGFFLSSPAIRSWRLLAPKLPP
jgi:hypothetical protein